MQSKQPKKWTVFMPATLLLVGALTLVGCGDGNRGAVDNDNDVPTVDVTLTPTEEPATDTITTTDTLTDTESMTDTEGMTETMPMTDTESMSGTEGMTETMPMTDTESMSETMPSTGTTMDGTTAMHGMNGHGISGADGKLIRAYTLLDYDFVNQDGGVSGEIEDLLVDVATGDILFATVEYGGLLDIGDTHLAIPLNAFQLTDNQLVLNFNEQELENFPSIGESWPDLTDNAWDDEVTAFWRNIDLDPGYDFTVDTSANVMWLSDMTGYTLMDLGEGVGTINDVLVDLGTSRIKYVLFDTGAGAVDDDGYILPYGALDPQNIRENEIAFGTNINLESLQMAPRFDRALYPDNDIIDAGFSSDIDTFWTEHGITID